MVRKEMLEVAEELDKILVMKKVTPNEAENIAEFLLEGVREKNEKGKLNYMMKGTFE